MFTPRLTEALGLMNLQAKDHASEATQNSRINTDSVALTQLPSTQEPNTNQRATVKLDKSEFRLLVKMLHAIGHDCTYDHIGFDGKTVTYQHPDKTLVFNDISTPDSKQIMNLSQLSDLLKDPSLKRAVWEKLKTLKQ